MGILSDFLATTPEDAKRYAAWMVERAVPEDRVRYVQYKGFTIVELATLWAIAERAPFTERYDAFEDLADEGGEEWLVRFPAALVDLLAAMDAREIGRVATEWAETEEIASTREEIEPVVADLVSLAKHARATGREMFLWGSL